MCVCVCVCVYVHRFFLHYDIISLTSFHWHHWHLSECINPLLPFPRITNSFYNFLCSNILLPPLFFSLFFSVFRTVCDHHLKKKDMCCQNCHLSSISVHSFVIIRENVSCFFCCCFVFFFFFGWGGVGGKEHLTKLLALFAFIVDDGFNPLSHGLFVIHWNQTGTAHLAVNKKSSTIKYYLKSLASLSSTEIKQAQHT